MSRIIAKGLPHRCSEQQIRDFFKEHGNITDCSLKYTKEGLFRRFAFIGFESDEAGNAAIKKLNNTYMSSYKILVEECKPFGDETKPRAWSKYAKDSSAYARANNLTPEEAKAAASKRTFPEKRSQKDGDADGEEGPPSKKGKKESEEYQTFLEARGISTKTSEQEAPVMKDEDAETTALKKELLEGISGDTKQSLIFTGLPAAIKPKHLKDWLAPLRVKALKVSRNERTAASFVTFEKLADARRGLQKNGTYFGGYQLVIEKIDDGEEEKAEAAKGKGNPDAMPVPGVNREEEESKIRDAILETGRLFLRNLPYTTNEDDVRCHMKKYGELADVQVIVDKAKGTCKGFAIVEYVFPESAVTAYAELDGSIFKGRMLHIIPGQEKKPEPKLSQTNEYSSYKQKKAGEQKKDAGKSHNWNALFLGPNAVAESLAEKIGVGKSDILIGDGDGESSAVRLALAETRLVRETRDFLLANGVRLDSFSRPASKRSDRVIIVKNLPAGVVKEDMENLFTKFGDLQKVLLPPDGGVSAIIAFGNTIDAKVAFQAMSYARFRTQPLYLEWAPGDVFETSPEEEEKEKEAEVVAAQAAKKRKGDELTVEEKKAERKSKKHKKKVEEEVKEEEPEVKTEVKEEEEEKPAKKTKKQKKAETVEDEPKAAPSEEREPEEGAVVFVKNLSWDTTDASLSKLFKGRGDIHSAKVSRKFNAADPSKPLSMGFGFVQFFTQEDAMDAVKTMQGSLLDGHCLELKISNRQMDEGKKIKERKGVDKLQQGEATKIIVRNLPFQATESEVESLFTTFGSVKSVRIPKKVGSAGQHRGFGFVDFATKGEAKRAWEALVHSTHLYGRRLVLEWAKGEEDSIDELRQKTAAKFTGDSKEQRKQKKQMEKFEKDLRIADDD